METQIEPRTRMKHFVDKSHAVGHIWCLEHHFLRITRILNEAGVPSAEEQSPVMELLCGEPKRLTVAQRVEMLAHLRKLLLETITEEQKLKVLMEMQSFVPTKDDQPIDPEEINERIWSEGDSGTIDLSGLMEDEAATLKLALEEWRDDAEKIVLETDCDHERRTMSVERAIADHLLSVIGSWGISK